MLGYLQERDERDALVKVLDSCPLLQTKGGRQDLIQNLGPAISGRVKDRDDRKTHILNIVRACTEVHDGIKILEDRLKPYEGEWTAWSKVEQAAERLRAKLAEEEAPTKPPDSAINVRTQTTAGGGPTAVATSGAKFFLNPAVSSEQVAPTAQQAVLAALPRHKEQPTQRTNLSPAPDQSTARRGRRLRAKEQATSASARESFVPASVAAQIIPYVKLLENLVGIYDDLILFDALLDNVSDKLNNVEALNTILHMSDTKSEDKIKGILERLEESIEKSRERVLKERRANADTVLEELKDLLEELEKRIVTVVKEARKSLNEGALGKLTATRINELGGSACRSLASATTVVQKIAGAIDKIIQGPRVQLNINGSRYGGHS